MYLTCHNPGKSFSVISQRNILYYYNQLIGVCIITSGKVLKRNSNFIISTGFSYNFTFFIINAIQFPKLHRCPMFCFWLKKYMCFLRICLHGLLRTGNQKPLQPNKNLSPSQACARPLFLAAGLAVCGVQQMSMPLETIRAPASASVVTPVRRGRS